MKRLQLILSMGFTTLGLSSAFGWTYIRYGLAKLSGSYYENRGVSAGVVDCVDCAFLPDSAMDDFL